MHKSEKKFYLRLMKSLDFCFMLILAITTCNFSAQNNFKRANIFSEMGGNSGFISINGEYFYFLNDKHAISASAGVGTVPILNFFSNGNEPDDLIEMTLVPLQLNYNRVNFGDGKNTFKAGLSPTFILSRYNDDSSNSTQTVLVVETTYRRFLSNRFFIETGLSLYTSEVEEFAKPLIGLFAFGLSIEK